MNPHRTACNRTACNRVGRLVIGAPGVTIDLAGPMIVGTGSGAGIDNSAGHDHVRVTGGTIRGFLFGVELFQASGARLDRLSADANVDGVKIARSDAVQLDRPGHTLTRNHANANQGLGIAAPDRTIDGGGNRAGGNMAGHCTGVVCS